MKLLIDVHCFDYNTSEGINTYLQGLYRELIVIAENVDFYFVARNTDKVRKIFGEYKNVHYIALTSNNRIYRLLFEIPAIIKKHKIDLAHFQYTSPLIKNCKTIVTLHDILFVDYPQYFPTGYKLIKGILFWLSARRADILLTVSEYSKEQIAKHYKIAKENIYVTPNAVDSCFEEIDSKKSSEFTLRKGINKYLLYVSRIEPRKNHIRVLKSYKQLKLQEKGYDLVFIGRQTIPVPEFDTYINSLSNKEKDHIHILNQVPFEELLYWYKSASLFLYPSLAEGFGIPPLEAAITGCPCVCSDRTSMKEFNFLGENLLDILDEYNLNQTIISNLEHRSNINILDIKNQITSKYNWKSSASILYNRLKKI